jgi:hypothetical protein
MMASRDFKSTGLLADRNDEGSPVRFGYPANRIVSTGKILHHW